MADLGTIVPDDQAAAAQRGSGLRRLRPRRGLPGGRAVVGGFLVAAAAVGLFAAYTSATGPPTTTYAVASRDVPIGTTLTGDEFTFVAMELPESVARAAVPEAAADQLAGLVTNAPLRHGDPLLESGLLDPGAGAATTKISFPVAPSRALMGQLRVGERVDVVATYGPGGPGTFTAYVVRGVQLVSVDEASGEFGEGTRVLTVGLHDPGSVLKVAHAVNTAKVFVTRASAKQTAAVPPPYRPAGSG